MYCLQAPWLEQCMTIAGIMVLAPDSRGATWDDLPAAQGSFGPDIAFINAALAQTFALYNVDAAKLGIQGFSDGRHICLGSWWDSHPLAMLASHAADASIPGVSP